MDNRHPVPAEDRETLLDFIRKGQLFALQDWLKTGKPLREGDRADSGPDLLRAAITTGFHNIVEELLRAGAWSPAELADALDLARSRNRDDLAALVQHHSIESPPDGLPPRAKRCLAAAGIPFERQAVLHALRTGALSWRTTLYGRYTHRDVCRWLGIAESFPSPTLPDEPSQPFPQNGLSYRTNKLLRRAGIPAEKSAVRQALETGTLVAGTRPINYGKQTHAELCRWVGLDVATLRRQVYLLGVAERRRAQKPSTKPSTTE